MREPSINRRELNTILEDLERAEKLREMLPAGDKRAEVARITKRVREMACEVDGAMSGGRRVENLLARMRNLIKLILDNEHS